MADICQLSFAFIGLWFVVENFYSALDFSPNSYYTIYCYAESDIGLVSILILNSLSVPAAASGSLLWRYFLMKTNLSPEYLEFNRLYKEESDIYREIALHLGASNSAISILYDLCLLGEGCTQKDICESSFLSKQTVNSAIRKLESGGYIYLEKGRGRSTHIYLTEAGEALMRQKIFPVMEAENSAFSALGDDGALLTKLMGKYLSNLRSQVQQFK